MGEGGGRSWGRRGGRRREVGGGRGVVGWMGEGEMLKFHSLIGDIKNVAY